LLALWWLGGQPMELSVPDLETVGPVDFGGTLSCGVAAHPKVDPQTGEMMFIDFCPYKTPYLRYDVISSAGQVTHHQVIDVPGPSLFHDLAITAHHTVLMDLPMVWDPTRLEQGQRRVRFQVERPARFGVLPRHGGAVQWFEAPACYCYHTINAWEEPGDDGQPGGGHDRLSH
jgi:carotenoid cleavage dioxygenase-like enzyme